MTHVLETTALVILQQSVLAAELATAEATITNDALSRLSAFLERTANLLGSHILCSDGFEMFGCEQSGAGRLVIFVARLRQRLGRVLRNLNSE